jgi:hypothetical protein
MLVCFDATVLCGAIRKPTGYNFKLLELAAGGAVLSGFTTDVAGMEFVRNALEGLSGVTYDMELIEAFLDHFAPLFNPDNIQPSPIGRARRCRCRVATRSVALQAPSGEGTWGHTLDVLGAGAVLPSEELAPTAGA